MNKFQYIDKIFDDVVNVIAILSIAFLVFHGVSDFSVFLLLAGLAGYRSKKRYDNGGSV